MPSQNLTIMFTDIKGFTQRVSEGSRSDLTDLRTSHDRLLIPVFNHFEGKIIKTIGDAFLVVFTSPTDAVMCGLAIQETLRQHNLLHPENKHLEVRVAINSGEVEVTENDVLGEPVNIAARLEGVAEAGEVYFTEAVYLSMNRSEAPSSEVGERTFKGIPYPVKVYQAIRESNTEFAKRLTESIAISEGTTVIKGLHRPGKSRLTGNRTIISALAAAILLAGLAFFAMPSGSVKALRQAREILESGDHDRAYSIALQQLNHDQENSELHAFVLEAAQEITKKLHSSQGPTVALEWLNSELTGKPFLTPLREIIPALDGEATGLKAAGKGVPDKERQELLDDLLNRYPKSGEAPLAAGRQLQGKVYHYYPLWMYSQAFSRGITPDQEIFAFCTDLMTKKAPGNVRTAHQILEQHFPDEAIKWASHIFDKDLSGSHHLFSNGWQILTQRKDPRINDPYNQSLISLANGLFGGQDEANRVIEIFLNQEDDFRKNQALLFARKRVTVRSGMMLEVERVRDALETAFGISSTEQGASK